MEVIDNDNNEDFLLCLTSYKGLSKWWIKCSLPYTGIIAFLALVYTYHIYQYNLGQQTTISLTRGMYYFMYMQLFYYVVGIGLDSFYRWYTGSIAFSLPDKKIVYYFLFVGAILTFFLLEMDLAAQKLFDDF